MECNEVFSISSFVHPTSATKDLAGIKALGREIRTQQRDAKREKLTTKYKVKYNVSTVDNVTITQSESGDLAPWWKTCIHKDLLWIKLFYFSFIGSLGCVIPYVAVFLKQLGLSPLQIGIISGIRPLIGFISGPLWGTVADRFNIRRILLMFSLGAWLAFYAGFFLISPADRITTCPDELNPHRRNIHVKVKRSVSANATIASLEPDFNFTDTQLDILTEHTGWSYDSEQLHHVFILTTLLIVCGEFFQSPTTALSDTGTLQALGPARRDLYGAQRAWGAIGWAVCSLIGGGIVSSTRSSLDVCGVELIVSDYHLLVYIFSAFMVVAALCALTIKFKTSTGDSTFDTEVKHSFKSVIAIFLNAHYISWVLTALYVGICNGVIWGFLYWHLDNLDASQLLMGVDSVIACLSEFAAYFIVGHVIKLVGHMKIMYMGLCGYALRFLLYAFISNPWWVLPTEVLQGVTFSAIWISLTKYTTEAVPIVSLATVQGLLHGIYFGLGNGLGHLLGGILIDEYGAKVTFISLASMCIIVLILFLIAQKMSQKPIKKMAYDNISDNRGETKA